MEFGPYIRGFGVGIGLIAAIGAQNAYILARGIHRNHHWLVASIASVIDALLITLGLLGMGQLVKQFPELVRITTIGGAIFLLVYGAMAFRNVFKSASLRAEGGKVSARQATLTVLAFSLLNPHVYLDTVVFLGSIGIQEASEHRFAFGAGAVTASFVWFFLLALGGQSMQGWFRKPLTWKILDGFIALVMWTIAVSLLKTIF